MGTCCTNIPILKFPDGTTKENATYDGVEIKQADVNLLAYPLEIISDRSQIEKDLAYYEPACRRKVLQWESLCFQPCMQDLGNPEKAYEIFVEATNQMKYRLLVCWQKPPVEQILILRQAQGECYRP